MTGSADPVFFATRQPERWVGADALRYMREHAELDPAIDAVEVSHSRVSGQGAWVVFRVPGGDAQVFADALTYDISEDPVPVDGLDMDAHGCQAFTSEEEADEFIDGASLMVFMGVG